MIIDDDVYLEHYGKKGMKWGSRRNARVQNRLDLINKVATGTATKKESRKVGGLVGTNQSTRKQNRAAKGLAKGASLQSKINSGKAKSADILLKAHGINIKDLNYHQN